VAGRKQIVVSPPLAQKGGPKEIEKKSFTKIADPIKNVLTPEQASRYISEELVAKKGASTINKKKKERKQHDTLECNHKVTTLPPHTQPSVGTVGSNPDWVPLVDEWDKTADRPKYKTHGGVSWEEGPKGYSLRPVKYRGCVEQTTPCNHSACTQEKTQGITNTPRETGAKKNKHSRTNR